MISVQTELSVVPGRCWSMTLPAAPVPHVAFSDLETADLQVDALYPGGTSGNTSDDPMSKLIKGVGNQGGFRYAGSPAKGTVKLAVLYTSGGEVDWPDHLDVETGTFTYYGDNRRPGQGLHGTPRAGNVLLRDVFAASHGTAADRAKVPPFFLFEKAGATGRSVLFRGLLAPGGPTLTSDDELAAIWRATASTSASRTTGLTSPCSTTTWFPGPGSSICLQAVTPSVAAARTCGGPGSRAASTAR